MKINIELELHPNTERPDEKLASSEILVLSHGRNFFGQLYYCFPMCKGEEEHAEDDNGEFKILWGEVDGWIAVSELKEQVMKASGK